MESKEVKLFIVQKKREGNTYSNISEMLESEFGIKKSRQAVQKLYKREEARLNEVDELMEHCAVILEYSSLGYKTSWIVNKLKETLGIYVPYDKVKDTIERNESYIRDREKVRGGVVKRSFESDFRPSEIEEIVSYNGERPTKAMMDKWLYEAVIKHLEEEKDRQLDKVRGYSKEVYNTLRKEVK